MLMKLKGATPVIAFIAVLALGSSVAAPTDFDDMPGDGFDAVIDHVTDLGIMEGCHGSFFCPGGLVTREEMAVWLERVEHYSGQGNDYVPPDPSGRFDDVPPHSCLAGWIEQLAEDGITAGCSDPPPLYCPRKILSRAEMAVFLVRVQHGAEFHPPPCAGVFDDVPCPGSWPPTDFIEQLAADGVTGGCSTDPPLYCPYGTVTRAQMAAFLSKVLSNKYCSRYGETCWNPASPETGPDSVTVTLENDDGHELVGQ